MARFANVSAVSGIDFPEDGRALCLVDWDHDGDLDFWLSNRTAPQLRFLRNDNAGGNHYLGLRLRGKTGNRDAIGARVEVSVPGRDVPILRTVRAGDGYLAQSSKDVLIGLGESEAAVRVTIRWPGGVVQEIPDVPVDEHYVVSEGEAPVEWVRPDGELVLRPSRPEAAPDTSNVRIPMVTLLKVPEMKYRKTDGGEGIVPVRGRATLLNLWASWCAPCLTELEEFRERHEALRKAGLEVVALAADGVGEAPGEWGDVQRAAARARFPFAVGGANEHILTILERLHVRLTPMELKLVIPISLLIDEQGRLAVVYKGTPGVDRILADLAHSSRPRAERLRTSLGLGGISLASSHVSVAEASDQLEITQRFQFAQDLWHGGYLESAAVHYAETLKLSPEFVEAINNLGLVYARMGDHSRAVATYRRALEVREDYAVAYLNLGLSLDAQDREIEARSNFLKALQLDPELPTVNDALGLLHARKGELALARDYFRAETVVNPDFAEGFNHLGLIHLSLNEAQGAVGPLQQAVALEPTNADAYNNLGLAYKRLGKPGEAGEAFRMAVKAAPRFVPALINLGIHLADHGNLEDAEKRFLEALKESPGSTMAQRQLARVRQLRGQGR